MVLSITYNSYNAVHTMLFQYIAQGESRNVSSLRAGKTYK